MGYKVFVSYKHKDSEVLALSDNQSNSSVRNAFSIRNESPTTAWNYLEELQELIGIDNIYMGEKDEDISGFSDERIREHLTKKMRNSSVTIVLVSKGMKERFVQEKKQWIPWEICYSLKRITSNERTSQTNAVIAVVLPDENGGYDYYIKESHCNQCRSRNLDRSFLFNIMSTNIHNLENMRHSSCSRCGGIYISSNEPSYIISIKWDDFVKDIDAHIDRAVKIRENLEDYNITRRIEEHWYT